MAVDDEPSLVEAELTVLVQQALVHVAGHHFGEKEVMAAQRDDLRDPALEVDGAYKGTKERLCIRITPQQL